MFKNRYSNLVIRNLVKDIDKENFKQYYFKYICE